MVSTYLNPTSVTDLLNHWLSRQAPAGFTWLDQKWHQIAAGASARVFFTAFSAVPRYLGKADLELTSNDLQAAQAVRPGWSPNYWSVDQAARTLLVLTLPQDPVENYLQTLDQVFTTADVRELVALYQALPLLPYPDKLYARAAEGVRSNMTAVFNAVALRNPYPTEYFDKLAWNQMVLKALFVGSSLHLIQGLDQRTNPTLAQMAVDYAHERRAARRSIPSELWQLVKPFAGMTTLTDRERVFVEPDPEPATAIASAQYSFPQAQVFAVNPALQTPIQPEHLTWSGLLNRVK